MWLLPSNWASALAEAATAINPPTDRELPPKPCSCPEPLPPPQPPTNQPKPAFCFAASPHQLPQSIFRQGTKVSSDYAFISRKLETNSLETLTPLLLLLNVSGSSGSCQSPACPSCPRRKRRTRSTPCRVATGAPSTSATSRSPWFPTAPGFSNKSWWTPDIRSKGRLVRVWPSPRPTSAMSQLNKSQETLVSTQVCLLSATSVFQMLNFATFIIF